MNSTVTTQRPFGTASRAENLSRQTREEYDTLVTAMHQLEAALAAAAPGRECAWNQRVRTVLPNVQAALEAHIHSAEGEDGLLAEIDLTRPTLVRSVERLRQDHADLLQQTEALHQEITRSGLEEVPAFASIRMQAARLLDGLRNHQAREVDLVFESLFTDIGTGD